MATRLTQSPDNERGNGSRSRCPAGLILVVDANPQGSVRPVEGVQWNGFIHHVSVRRLEPSLGNTSSAALRTSETGSGKSASRNFAQELKAPPCLALRLDRQLVDRFPLHQEKIAFRFVNQIAESVVVCHAYRTFNGNQLL